VYAIESVYSYLVYAIESVYSYFVYAIESNMDHFPRFNVRIGTNTICPVTQQ